MVKIKLSDEQKVSFQNIHYMLCSKDKETQNLAYNLAKEELNFNIGWYFIYNPRPFFKSISQCIENTSSFELQFKTLDWFLLTIINNGYYYL